MVIFSQVGILIIKQSDQKFKIQLLFYTLVTLSMSMNKQTNIKQNKCTNANEILTDDNKVIMIVYFIHHSWSLFWVISCGPKQLD